MKPDTENPAPGIRSALKGTGLIACAYVAILAAMGLTDAVIGSTDAPAPPVHCILIHDACTDARKQEAQEGQEGQETPDSATGLPEDTQAEKDRLTRQTVRDAVRRAAGDGWHED